AAAILHNCGHFISHSSHHKHSYYLIRHGELLGYTEVDIEVIANIARYHRKSQPRKKHENYRNLPTKYHRQVVNHLSALLRVAVALDRRGIGAISQVTYTFDPDSRVLALRLQPAYPNDDCASELWNLHDKKLWLEALFDITVVAELGE
ncbi:MAG: HD domain-containing protein, partial [Cyanobacteria bacterium]|nr:HD domain-containing protein [Cyanobacteriota bacterium]